MDRNCYDWLKKILVFEVVTGRIEVFPGHDLGRTRPEIVVFVSEVVIAKVNKNTVFFVFFGETILVVSVF